MRTILRSTALVVLLLGVASQASAGDKAWSVAGVFNNGIATVFSCTNGSTAPASVTVAVFQKDGTPSGLPATNSAVPAGATVNMATQTVAVLGVADALTINMGNTEVRGGSARITASSGVFCTAYLVSPLGDPPTVMMKLSVVKKTNQKGD